MFGFGKAINSKIGNDKQPKRESELYADAFGGLVKPVTIVSDFLEGEPTTEAGTNIELGLGMLIPFGKI